jgi:hypothetical protein
MTVVSTNLFKPLWLLNYHIKAGNIFTRGGAYFGIRTSGRAIRLGLVGEEKNIEDYLVYHQDCESWEGVTH